MQYRIVSPVKWRGGTHQPGELVDFNLDESDELLKIGAIETAYEPFAPGNLSLNVNIGGRHV